MQMHACFCASVKVLVSASALLCACTSVFVRMCKNASVREGVSMYARKGVFYMCGSVHIHAGMLG